MKDQGLTPGVKHAERARQQPQLAACDIGERGPDGSKEKVVKDARRVQGQNVQFLRHGEDHMKVRDRKKLGRAGVEPLTPRGRLAAWACPVTTGMPLNVFVPAAVTLLPLPAKGGRPARADRAHRLPLHGSGAMSPAIGLTAGSHDRAEIALGCHRLSRAQAAA